MAVPQTQQANVFNGITLSAGQIEFYDKNLLERAKPFLCLEKFGQRRPIAMRQGNLIRMRRFNALAVNVSAIVEGVLPAGKTITVTDVSAALTQYGDYTIITDMVNMTGIDPIITEATDILGEQAGLSVETVIRGVVSAGTLGTGLTTAAVAAALTLANIQTGVRVLKRNLAKPFTTLIKSGTGYGSSAVRPSYWMYTHPDLQKTLELLTGYVPVEKYAAQNEVMDNEIGAVAGVRIVVSTVAKVTANAGTTTNVATLISTGGTSIDVYESLIFGKDAFGVIPLGSKNFETIVKREGGSIADPLNQFAASVGWKATFAAKILNDSWLYRIGSGATA